jgi:hypothetical protein
LNLLLCWLVGPAALLAVAIGLSMGVELITRTTLSWRVRPAIGLATMIVLAQLGVSTDTTAELTLPLITGLGAFGLVMGWSAGLVRDPIPRWEIAAALGVYLIFGAPVILSGEPTWAGYIKLDDTATWMGVADHSFKYGPRTDFPISTWEALIKINTSSGYPIGSFVPMALIGKLAGQDVAWTIQPSMALMAATLTLLIAEVVRPLLPSAPIRAGIAFLAAQSSMLIGYTLWGGVKESAAAALLALAPLAAWLAVERTDSTEARWLWVIPGISATALIATLGPSGAVWVVPTMAPLLFEAWRRFGRGSALGLAAKTTAFAVAATIPQLIGPNGLFNPFQSWLFAETELGNLRAPLGIMHAIGVWPAHDFRDPPRAEVLTKILIVVLAAMAVYGAYRAVRDRGLTVAAYVIGGAIAMGASYIVGSPWIQGKAMTIASPALLTGALVGIALLIQRTRFNIEGWLIAAFTSGLILWSSLLAFEGVWLAPYAEHRELETIGNRFDGEGPALITEGSTYGGRHFLRDLEAENAKDLRRRQVLLANGSLPDEVRYLDTDMIATDSLSPYNLIVLRRSPVASRPPGAFRLAYTGTYYEVWERGASPAGGGSLVDRLPLGEPPSNSAVPSCDDVAALAKTAGPTGTLVAARPSDSRLVSLEGTALPAGWISDGGLIVPRADGTMHVPVTISAPGTYRVWIGGNIYGGLSVSAGGQSAPEVRQALNINRYQPFGPFTLPEGETTIELRYDAGAGLHPGSGVDSGGLGPVFLEHVLPPDRGEIVVRAAQFRQLCNEPWDWIEAYD